MGSVRFENRTVGACGPASLKATPSAFVAYYLYGHRRADAGRMPPVS